MHRYFHLKCAIKYDTIPIEPTANQTGGVAMPLADILRECGYDNPDTFCRVFTDLYGADPEKYRLSHFAHRS